MNSQEFEIEFYAKMSEWVSGGKVGPDPWGVGVPASSHSHE